jgi:mitotic spindle assembly checkpoint protein MAD1
LKIWTAKSQEFREAVFSLLGYRLDFLQNGRVRCTSMFSTSTDQAFIFDGEEGTMQLVSQDAVEKNREWFEGVKQLVDFWVNERETIPGFLAALTLELYDRSVNNGA